MRFEVRDTNRFPRPTVFAVHRDELEQIAASMPDVERVEVRGRSRHADGREEQITHWAGSPSALPALIRPMVPASMLQWRQTTLWDPRTYVATWTIDLPGLGGAVHATGSNRYLEAPGGTTIEVEGDFAFRPEVVPQLKSIPASAVPIVERAVVSMIVPMIERTGSAVAKYLDEHPLP